MKYFKVETSRKAKKYEITLNNFKKTTSSRQPYEQENNKGGFSQYAICPSCLNPIQLIGLVQKTKVTPYGRHAGKNINGLSKWDYQKYRYCPYAAKQDHIAPYAYEELDDILIIDENAVEMYDLLKEEFDRVVYLVSRALNIKCTKIFWENALHRFLADRTYCYPWLTDSNLPYIFAYRGLHQQNILGMKFLINSSLYQALNTHPNVKFEMYKSNPDYAILQPKDEAVYLNLQFRFSHHEQKAVEGRTLHETMMFYVDDLSNDNIIYQKQIEFDETFFPNLINKENTSKRQQWLLDIASELMPGIQINEN